MSLPRIEKLRTTESNHEEQIAIIEKPLYYILGSDEQSSLRKLIVKLVHSLLQPDPDQRDPDKVLELVRQLDEFV